MKFSVFTVQTPSLTVEEVAKAIHEAGYQGVEWRVNTPVDPDLSPLPPKEQWFWVYNKATVDINHIEEQAPLLRKLQDTYKLETVSLSTYLVLEQLQEIEAVMKTAKEIGCKMIRINAYKYDGTQNYTTLLAKAQKELQAVETLCKKYGVQANLEQHMNTMLPSASAARRLMENSDPKWIGVIFDAGNMVYEGFEQYKLGMEALGPYLHHVHIKDATGNTGPDGYKAEWSAIGSGAVNFNNLKTAMQSVGYDGYLSTEDFSPRETDAEKLVANMQFLKKTFG